MRICLTSVSQIHNKSRVQNKLLINTSQIYPFYVTKYRELCINLVTIIESSNTTLINGNDFLIA